MFRSGISRYATIAASIALSLAVAAGPAMAQAQQPAPHPATLPQTIGMLEGSVKKVDPDAGTLQVSLGPFGILGRTLEVTGGTQIQVEGRQGTLADIREGTMVKASYETREGKNVATQIEVMPAREGAKGGAGQMPGKSR